MAIKYLNPPPSRRSHGLIQQLFNLLLDCDSPTQPNEHPLPPKELQESSRKLMELLEDSPLRSLVKLDKDFHQQPKMEGSFESMVVSSGGVPAGNLTLADTLTLTQGLIHNFKHHASAHDGEYVMLVHALVDNALEREQMQGPRDAQKVTTALQKIAHSTPEALDGNSYGISYPKKIRSTAQFKDVEEISRQLTMLTDGVEKRATAHLSNRSKELLRETRDALVEHLGRMQIPEFNENMLYANLYHKLRHCPVSRQYDSESNTTTFTIKIPQYHIMRMRPEVQDRLIATLRGGGAEVDASSERIIVTPETDSLVATALSALEKQANRPARHR